MFNAPQQVFTTPTNNSAGHSKRNKYNKGCLPTIKYWKNHLKHITEHTVPTTTYSALTIRQILSCITWKARVSIAKIRVQKTTKRQRWKPHTEFQGTGVKRLLAPSNIRVTTNRSDAPPEGGSEQEGERPENKHLHSTTNIWGGSLSHPNSQIIISNWWEKI